MKWRKKWPLLLLLVVMTIGLVTVVAPQPASAAACYGTSCNGLDPNNRCNGDAVNAKAMDVKGEGMLQLRYSPSCKANWGRFTFYTRIESGYLVAGIIVHARVTVWNPGKPSYGTAHYATFIGESSWSYMTNGLITACTGVEITHVLQSSSGSGAIDEIESLGWVWGPCA